MTDRVVKVRLKGDISDYNRAILRGVATTKAFANSLESSNDRMTNLVQSSLALGPALVPIGAAAVPAISGLTNQLAFAAVGAGVTALAFSGIGDALKAVNDYSLEPSVANFQKMSEAMATLGPAGQDFAMYLQAIRPELQRLQDVAQQGLLPGAQEGIEELMTLMPQAERVVSTVATAIGDLIAEAGDNLNDPRWVEFFEFIETEARPTLMDMGRTLGNFAEGFANLWMAFDPISDSFSKSFLQLSRDFAQWTDGLDETQGFQEFVDYINDVGPQAWDTLGALGNALLQIVEAAAPVGAAVLPVIEALADGLSAVADSDFGPLIIGVVSLTSALGRLRAIGAAANSSALGGIFGKSGYGGLGPTLKSATTATNDLRAAQQKLATSALAARDAQFALIPTGDKRKALATYSTDLKAVAKAEASAAAATRARRVQMGQMAAGAAGLAFVMSDLDDKMGLTNTATLGLMGSLAGPWGAAVGAGVGAAMDLAAANDSVGDSFQRLNNSLKLGAEGYDVQVKALADLKAKTEEYEASRNKPFAILGQFGDAKNNLEEIFGTSQVDENAAQYKKAAAAVRESKIAKDEARAAELGLSVDLDGTSGSLRGQTLAVLENIAAHNERNNENLTALDKEIAYQKAIDATTASIKENGRNTDINTAAGQANVASLSAQAAAWNGLEPASQLASGAQEKARAQFIKSAEAMGYNAKKAREMAADYLNVPPDIPTEIKLLGKDASAAQIADLLDTYNLAREDVVAQLKASNLTQPQINKVLAELDKLDKKKTDPRISVEDAASARIKAIKNLIDGLTGKKVTIETVYKRTIQGGTGNPGVYGLNKADGGLLVGPGGPRDDLIPVNASNGEFIVNAAATEQYLPLLHQINARKFADGGPVATRLPTFAAGGAQSVGTSPAIEIDYDRLGVSVAKAIHALPIQNTVAIGKREAGTLVTVGTDANKRLR